MRFRKWAPAFFTGALLLGCQKPVLDAELQVVDCEHATEQIAALRQELTATNERIASGIKTIIPVSALVHLFRGELKREAKIATGEYNKMLLEKIGEIESKCAL